MKFWKSWRRFIENQRGAYLVIVAVLLPLLLTFAGLAVDLGRGYAHKAKLQNAADAGVMAAAHIYFPDKSHDEVYEWAQRYMDANHGNEAYNIDQITVRTLKEGTSSNDEENTVLISLYASEKVPVSFMAVMGFDAMPVNVVATAKVTPKLGEKDPGVWGYSFICGDDRDATQCGDLWDWRDQGKIPFQFLQSKHKILGAVHTNGAIGLNGGWAAYSALVKTGNFSTSLASDELLWKRYRIDGFHNEDGSAKNELFTNDIEVAPGVWEHYTRMGYYDMTTVNKDVVANKSPTISTEKLDISLSSSNSKTQAIYEYVEGLRKQYGDKYDSGSMFIDVHRNYNSNRHLDGINYESWNDWESAKRVKTIVVDGSVVIGGNGYPKLSWDTDDHLTIISLHGDVTLAIDEPVKALIYAPNGRVTFSGVLSDENIRPSFEGSIVGKYIQLNGKQQGNGEYVTYKWNDFGFGTGSGNGSSGAGSGSSSGTGGVESIILYKDEDPNYGNEQAI